MQAVKAQPTSVRVGFILFALGLVFLAITVLPFFFGEHNRPVWLNVGCMLAPIGLVVAIVGAGRSRRAEQRAAAAASRELN
jgi:peptidoglycan/LPS O-acetylase OafA/YrhL